MDYTTSLKPYLKKLKIDTGFKVDQISENVK